MMGTNTHVCIALCGWTLVAAACSSSDPDGSWTLLREDEPAALLSIWGANANDVWVVGARAELTGGPTVLHYHDDWTRVDTGHQSLDLWSVFGLSSDDIFFGGSGGTILRLRGATFERMTTPRTGTIFGIWGANERDIWAVGSGGADRGIVWHFDGTQWTEPALPAGVPNRVFKVHGQSADDVWMSCGDGSVLHWQGTSIERHATGIVDPLFSIVTTPDLVIAVGGVEGQGRIVEHATDWAIAPMTSPVAWRGTAARDSTVYAIGELGVVAKREADVWTRVDQRLSQQNFHGGWIDPDGGLWVAGGDFDRAPLTSRGVLEYLGSDSITEVHP